MTKSEIKNLEERISKLNENQETSLTTEEANLVRSFWIQLNYSPEEAQEYSALDKRREVLYQNWLAGKRPPEEQDEWTRVSGRCTEIAHDIVMKRVIANHILRDRVWPELAPRVLMFRKLSAKTIEELNDDETEELKGLLEWFSKLRQEALRPQKQQETTP